MYGKSLLFSVENLALSGEASQINTYGFFHASNGNDGDYSTLANTGSVGANAWWKVVLKRRSFIDSIVASTRHNNNFKRINGSTIYVDDQFVGTVIFESGKQHYSFNALGLYGSVVKVWGGQSYVALGEVEVYGWYSGTLY